MVDTASDTGELEAFRAGLRSSIDRTVDAVSVPLDDDDWRALLRPLGVPGLLVREERGGAGADVRAAAIAVEELASSLAPGEALASLWGTYVLSRGDEAAYASMLEGVASGVIRLAAGLPRLDEHGEPAPGIVLTTNPSTGQRSVTGVLHSLTRVDQADGLVFLAGSTHSRWVCVVDLPSAEIEVVPAHPYDLSRSLSRLTLGAVPVQAVELDDAGVLDCYDLAQLLMGAEALGVVRAVLERDVAYCNRRVAFGRPVGSFQAVKHRLAELYCLMEQTRSMLDEGIDSFLRQDPSRRMVATALACVAGPTAVRVANEGLRLLGGIGYTWDDDAHLFLRRARANQLLVGPPHAQRRRMAMLAGLR